MSNFLYKLIRKLLFKLIAQKKDEHSRFLSIPDYIIDRWERAKLMGFGEGSSVYDSCLVLGDVIVGKNVWIGPYTVLDGTGGLTIGDNCNICAGVHIYTHCTVNSVVYKKEIEKAPVVIRSNVYIGPHTIVTMGCQIGDRVIIGANSLVNKDIPANTKAFGTPARIVDKIEYE
jgi:acetyltransferase-like isoleucine patch superfamily enzyme